MRKTVITVIFVAIAGLSATLRAQNDFEIVKNVDIFINVLNELNQKYADEISPGELTQTAIKAMLKSLDPYTVYYNEGELESYRMTNTGESNDIDVTLQTVDKQLVVTDMLGEGPSVKAGLRVGDHLCCDRNLGRRDGEVVRECGSKRREHRGREGQCFFHGNVPIDKAYACSRLLSTVFDENMFVMVVDFIAAIRLSTIPSVIAMTGYSPGFRGHNTKIHLPTQ